MAMNRNYNCDDEKCCPDFKEFNNEKFTSQIKTMMYSFGDVKEPLEESVIIVKSILRQDMNNLLIEAESIAQDIRKKGDTDKEISISHKHLLFLLRKNKGKLKHLIEYLQVLDEKHALKLKSTFNDRVKDNNKKKNVDECIEFLKSIEDCKEYTSALKDDTIIDQTRWNVLMKRNWLAKFMDKEEYLQYTKEVLLSSFCTTERISCFKSWLLNDNVIELPLTDLACTIIRFLARETIAKIVDLALQLQKRKAELDDQHNTDFYRYTHIVFDAITDSFCPQSSDTEMIETRKDIFLDSSFSANDKNKSDYYFSENWPGCSQSLSGEHRKDSFSDCVNSTPDATSPAEKDDDFSDKRSFIDSESENSASEFVFVEDSKSSDAFSKSYRKQLEDSNFYLKKYMNSPEEISETESAHVTLVRNNVSSTVNEIPQDTSSTTKQNDEHNLNIADEEDTSSVRINHSWEERFNKRTAITDEEIRQAYAEFQKPHFSNVFWNRGEKPKPRLLCID